MAAHNNADTIMPTRSPKGRRLQSAIEFLTTYGFALLVLSIAIALVLVLANFPQSTVPPTCTFPGYVNCITVAIGSNALGSRVVLLLSNPQQFALESVSASINISGLGIYTGPCTPNFVLSGGDASCTINSGNKVTPNQLAKGTITITASVCTQVSQSGCGSPVSQTYTGQFVAHVSPYVPSPQCAITLTAQNNTVYYSTGVADPLIANVKILGYNIAGASVNYTYSGSNIISLAPQYINTGTNGNAISYAYGENTGSSTITAKYSTCSASNIINSVAPIYISFTADGTIAPIPKTSIIVAVNNIQYSLQQLPAVWASDPGDPHSYLYYPYPVSPGERIGPDMISGTCGATANPGVVSSLVSCNVIAHYNYQYYLTVMADPGEGGSTTPSGSEWLDAGTVQPITATNAIGFTFSDWSGTGSGSYTGTSASSSVTMDGPITENAIFSLIVNPQASPSSPSALDLLGAGDSIPSDPTGAFTVLSGPGSAPYYGLGGTHPYTYTWSSSCPGFVNPGTTAPAANAFKYIPTGSTAGCDFGLSVQDSYSGYGGPATGSGTTQTIIVNPALSASTGITCYSLATGGTSLSSVSCSSAFDYAGQIKSNANESQPILAPVSENSTALNNTSTVETLSNANASNSTGNASSSNHGNILTYSDPVPLTMQVLQQFVEPITELAGSVAIQSTNLNATMSSNASYQDKNTIDLNTAFNMTYQPVNRSIPAFASSYTLGATLYCETSIGSQAPCPSNWEACIQTNAGYACDSTITASNVLQWCVTDNGSCTGTNNDCYVSNPYTSYGTYTFQYWENSAQGATNQNTQECIAVGSPGQGETESLTWTAYVEYTPPPPATVELYAPSDWEACLTFNNETAADSYYLCTSDGTTTSTTVPAGTNINDWCAAPSYVGTPCSATGTYCPATDDPSPPFISNSGSWQFDYWYYVEPDYIDYDECYSGQAYPLTTGNTYEWEAQATYTSPVSLTVSESPAGAASQWYACISYLEPSGSSSSSSYACAGPSTSSSETVDLAPGTTATYWCVGGSSCEAYQASSCTGTFSSYTWSYWYNSAAPENTNPCPSGSASLTNSWTAEFNSIAISATSSSTDMIPYESSTVQDTTTGATGPITYTWSDTGTCPSYTSQTASYFTYTPTSASGSSTTYTCTFNAESQFSQSCSGHCTYSYDPTASTPAISIFQPYVDVSASTSGGTEYATSPYYYYSWAVAGGTSCPNFASPGDVSSFVYYPTDTSDTALTCKFSATVSDDAYYPEYYTATTSAIDITPATGSGTPSTTTTISCSPTSFSTSSSTTCTATVSGGSGTITGTVSFTTTSAHGTFTGSPCTLSATSPYTCSVTYADTSTGSPTLTATYAGNNPGSSGTTIVTVTGSAATTYTLTESAPNGGGGVGTSNPTVDGTSYPCYTGCTTEATGLSSGFTTYLSETPDSGNTFVDWVGIGPGSYTGTNPTNEIFITTGNIIEDAYFQGSGSGATYYPITIDMSPSATSSSWETCVAFYLPNYTGDSNWKEQCIGAQATGWGTPLPGDLSSNTFELPSGSTVVAVATNSPSSTYSFSDWSGSYSSGYPTDGAEGVGPAGSGSLDLAVTGSMTFQSNYVSAPATEQITLQETPLSPYIVGPGTVGYTTTVQQSAYYYEFCAFGSSFNDCVGGTGAYSGEGLGYPASETFTEPDGSTINQICYFTSAAGSSYSLYNETNQPSVGAAGVISASQFSPYTFGDGVTGDCESVSIDVDQNYVESLNFGYALTVRSNPGTDSNYYEFCAEGHGPYTSTTNIYVCAGGEYADLGYPSINTVTLPAGSWLTTLCNYTSAAGFPDILENIANAGEWDGTTFVSNSLLTPNCGTLPGAGIDMDEQHVVTFFYESKTPPPPSPTYTLTIEGPAYGYTTNYNNGESPYDSSSDVCSDSGIYAVDVNTGTTILDGCGTSAALPAGTPVDVWAEYTGNPDTFCGWVGFGSGAYGNPYYGCGSLGNLGSGDPYFGASLVLNSNLVEVATELGETSSGVASNGNGGGGASCGGDAGGCSGGGGDGGSGGS